MEIKSRIITIQIKWKSIMRKNTTCIITICLLLLVSGCRKYDEGPYFSLRSKKARVVGKWNTEMWLVNKYEQIYMLDTNRTAEFTDDGKYYYHEYNPFTHIAINAVGDWSFRKDKEQLLLSLPGLADSVSYQLWDIKKLKNKELWLEFVDYGFPNSTLYQWRMKPR
jgi:hypothetical protein